MPPPLGSITQQPGLVPSSTVTSGLKPPPTCRPLLGSSPLPSFTRGGLSIRRLCEFGLGCWCHAKLHDPWGRATSADLTAAVAAALLPSALHREGPDPPEVSAKSFFVVAPCLPIPGGRTNLFLVLFWCTVFAEIKDSRSISYILSVFFHLFQCSPEHSVSEERRAKSKERRARRAKSAKSEEWRVKSEERRAKRAACSVQCKA